MIRDVPAGEQKGRLDPVSLAGEKSACREIRQ